MKLIAENPRLKEAPKTSQGFRDRRCEAMTERHKDKPQGQGAPPTASNETAWDAEMKDDAESRRRRRVGEWVANATLLVVSIAVSLGLGEWLARSAGEDMTPPVPLTAYLPRPWGSVMAPAVAPGSVNSYGSFDIEHALQKPEETIRIAVLGDSFLGLPTLPHDAQAPQLLKHELDKSSGCATKSCEVLNFSVSSAGTVNEVLRYELDARRFDPDLVVVFFTVSNDARNNGVRLQNQVEAAPIPMPGFELKHDGALHQILIPASPGSFVYYEGPVGQFLVRNSALYRKATRLWQTLRGARTVVPPEKQWAITASFLQAPYTVDVGDAWDVTEALFGRLEGDVKRDGGRLVVVLIPTSWDIEPKWKQWLFERLPASMSTQGFDFDLPYREITSRLARLDLPVLDLRPAFRAAIDERPQELLYDETGHWSARGHAVASKAVAPFLADQLKSKSQ